MKGNIKKILALLMVICMTITYMPSMAFAESIAGVENTQIVGFYEADEKTGELSTTVTTEGESKKSYADGAVVVDKTIEVGERENEFNVKLSVQTKEALHESVASRDVATVIVIDVSGSMNNNSKMTHAKNAAQEFINNYVDASGLSTRKVAIVKFSGNYSMDNAKTVQTWIDAEDIDTSKNTEHCTAIKNLNAGGGTNIEAGLILAKNILKEEVKNKKGEVITNKNVILFTDGQPTLGVADAEAGTTSTTVVCASGSNVQGDANNVSHPTHKDIGNLVTTFKGMNVSPYAIYVGSGNVNCSSCGLGESVYDWLTNCGFKAYSTTNVNEISQFFKNILETIELKAQAWEVTDPMGGYVELDGVNGELDSSNKIENKDNKLYWNIRGSEPAKVEEVGEETFYTYELEYTVTLDNLAENFVPGEDYAANGITGVTYFVTKNDNGQMDYESGTAYFNVPAVKGFASESFEFTKVDSLTGEPIKNVEFTLTTEDDSEWSMVATSDENGNVKFDKIPSGHTYTLKETVVPEGYHAMDDATVVVNYGEITTDLKIVDGKVANVNKTKDISGTKTWDDAEDQDGKRPESIVVNLLADGTVIDSKVVTENDDWAWTFAGLPTHKNGVEIAYTISEDAVEGYEATIDGYNVTNKHEVAKTSVAVKKVWEDADNQDGIRPESVNVILYADGDATATVELSEANQWQAVFEDLDANKAGKAIAYTVEEEVPEGYTVEITGTAADGFVVTNTHEVAKTSVAVKKVWEDADNQDGVRPESLVVELYADGMTTERVLVLSEANDWSSVFVDLDVYKDGEAIEYAVVETEVPDGYTAEITGTAAEGFVVTNTHEVAKTYVAVKKVWEDANNQDGIRPESVNVVLYANGEATDLVVELNEANQWQTVFEDLDVNKAGKAIVYTVEEADVPQGYKAEVTGTAADGYVITNSLIPKEIPKTGDHVNMLMWPMLMVASVGTVALILKKEEE